MLSTFQEAYVLHLLSLILAIQQHYIVEDHSFHKMLTCVGHCKISIRIFFASDNPPISSHEQELPWYSCTPRSIKGTLLFKATSKSLSSNFRVNAALGSWVDTAVNKHKLFKIYTDNESVKKDKCLSIMNVLTIIQSLYTVKIKHLYLSNTKY